MSKLRTLYRKIKRGVSKRRNKSIICAIVYGCGCIVFDIRDMGRRVMRISIKHCRSVLHWIDGLYRRLFNKEILPDGDAYYTEALPRLPFKRLTARKTLYSILNRRNEHSKVVISLTSYPARFATLPQCLKSIAYQTIKPDRVILYLSREECGGIVPRELKRLERYGLEIKLVEGNLKPHKKFFYSMQECPNDIIITIDDDVMYERDTVESFLVSYKKHPDCVSARRLDHIRKNADGSLMSYNDWDSEYTESVEPSFMLLSTGVGGVLYPPHCLPQEAFDAEAIKRLCLNADDVWLYFMERKVGVRTVWVPNNRLHPYPIVGVYEKGLYCTNNGIPCMNDVYIRNVMEYLGIKAEEIV